MLATSVPEVNDDSVGIVVEINVNDIPIVAHAKELSVMGVQIVHHSKTQKHRLSRDHPLNSPKNHCS